MYNVPDPDALFRFGGGSGPIHFSGFQCSGAESHLVNCFWSFDYNCSHFEDAGVRCLSGKHVIVHPSCIKLIVLANLTNEDKKDSIKVGNAEKGKDKVGIA